MKTSKVLVAAVLSGVMFVSSVFATEGEKPGSASSDASNAVREQIVNALSDVPVTGQEVMIRFAVTEKKGFKLLNVDGDNSDLVVAVKSELASERILVPAEMEGVYSLKVRFSNESSKKEDAVTALRLQIADALSSVYVSEPSSVKVVFSVNDNAVSLKRVEGSNKALVTSVESTLEKSTIVAPAELAGNYSVVVKF